MKSSARKKVRKKKSHFLHAREQKKKTEDQTGTLAVLNISTERSSLTQHFAAFFLFLFFSWILPLCKPSRPNPERGQTRQEIWHVWQTFAGCPSGGSGGFGETGNCRARRRIDVRRCSFGLRSGLKKWLKWVNKNEKIQQFRIFPAKIRKFEINNLPKIL